MPVVFFSFFLFNRGARRRLQRRRFCTTGPGPVSPMIDVEITPNVETTGPGLGLDLYLCFPSVRFSHSPSFLRPFRESESLSSPWRIFSAGAIRSGGSWKRLDDFNEAIYLRVVFIIRARRIFWESRISRSLLLLSPNQGIRVFVEFIILGNNDNTICVSTSYIRTGQTKLN